MADETQANTEQFIPTAEEQTAREKAYRELNDMIDVKELSMAHFSMSICGEQSWLSYIDNNERLMNGYTPSRESQGKEDWQSNGFDNVTRAKLRALAAAVGLKVPEMEFSASNKEGVRSVSRSEIMKQTVRHSFLDGNPTLQSFMEIWHMLVYGVVFEYDGYLSGGAKRKIVDSYNSETGEVTWKEEYVKVDGKPISIILAPQEFFWANMFVRDVQAQPRLGWLQKYSKGEIETEFSKYPNYKYIKNKSELGKYGVQTESIFYKPWSSRVNDDDYEVYRRYSKEDDEYEIWINGVPLLRAPLLWGQKEKSYPFAKSISEPFANVEFFVGMAFPHLLESFQDIKNTTVNTVVDKFYRSLKKPLLIGLGNKDLLDIEQDLVDEDNRMYVPDVNQVKPFPFEGVSQSDLAMWQTMDKSINALSIDQAQQGQQVGDVTARGAIIADERARQLKGILFMFLEDLWLQKNKLRVETILTQYIKDKAKRTSFKDNTITVPDVVFNDGTRGTLDIHIASTKSKLLPISEIEAREQAATDQGLTYKLLSITVDYLDEWEYDFQVIPESLYNQDRLKKETNTMEKMQRIATLFPQRFVAASDQFFSELLDIYGDSPDKYPKPAPPPPPTPQPTAPTSQDGSPTPASSTPLDIGTRLLATQDQ